MAAGMAGSWQVVLATAACLLAGTATAQATGYSTISTTRCNTDFRRGELNDPCGTLYEAICDVKYCRCPQGTMEHPHLHRCVQKSGDDGDDIGRTRTSSGGARTSDLFDDLPFDYEPPTRSSTGRPLPPPPPSRTRVGVSETRCNAGNNPCDSLHRAICSGDRCVCPHGTIENQTFARCDPQPMAGHDHDHDHDDHDHDDHNDKKHNAGNFGPVGNAVVIAAVVTGNALLNILF